MEWTRVATWDPGSSSSAPLPQTLPHHRLTPVDLHNLQSSIGQVPVYFSQISASSNSPPQAALTAVSSGVRAIAIDIAIAMQTVKRHQNQSCTQCRKSKKACDGYLLNGTQRHPSNATASSSSSRQIPSNPKILPCTYCVKTKKDCSLNPQWGQRLPSAGQASPSAGDSPGEVDAQPKRQRTEHLDAVPDMLGLGSMGFDITGSLNMMQAPSGRDPFDWNAPLLNLEGPADPFPSDSLGPFYADEENPHREDALRAMHDSLPLETPASTSTSHTQPVALDRLGNPVTDGGSQHSQLSIQGPNWDLYQPYTQQRPSVSSTSSLHRKRSIGGRYRGRHGEPDDLQEQSVTSLSPFSAPHTMLASSNNNLISESLLRIYHDVLENNLACWVAEDTCPYKMQQKQQDLRGLQRLPGAEEQQSPLEWGAMWSNRMYRRVKQLDRVAQSTRLLRLSRSESKAAARALDLAIMAFATQWSQGKRRREAFSPETYGRESSPSLSEDDDFSDEFEQTLQLSMYEQARKALRDVADLESYRVVYAELVFGLVQKPWAANKSPERTSFEPIHGDRFQTLKAAILPQVMDIMAQDGPPIYLERATRKIHALKFRFEASEAGYQANRDGNATQRMSHEDRGTIGLLYWLAVMFDTVSSSMNERPVALADEDCPHDELDQESHTPYSTSPPQKSTTGSRRWVLDLYAQDNPEKPWPLHWPCPYDVTTRAVARSAAVKVLLFRYISYFQNALRRKERGDAIEDIIQSTTAVYRYWNVTHGAFFRDLIKNYDSVPTRIRSWFPCIAIPWHLGALMFADLLDHVDNNGLGTPESSAARVGANMAKRIRQSSSIELSDLARATTPQDLSDKMPAEQLPEFHFAVNEGTLLTEPWTVLLIRAFTKASLFHLGAADDLRQNDWSVLGHESEDLQASLKRGESCINALWFLGRKSEMARDLAKVLGQVLHQQETVTFLA